jgi:hypothetical protein
MTSVIRRASAMNPPIIDCIGIVPRKEKKAKYGRWTADIIANRIAVVPTVVSPLSSCLFQTANIKLN